jgi:hypothetical protein
MILPLAVAGAAATAVAWLGLRFWEQYLGHHVMPLKLGAVFVPAAAAGLVYWLAALAMKVPAAKEMSDFVFQKLRHR